MWIGNLMLVILNLPLIGVWVQLLRVPYGLLYPMILTFCCIGVYSINNNPFDVYITIICGALGYLAAFLILGKRMSSSRKMAIINRTREMGRVKKVDGSPRERSIALLRFSSIIGPRMKPRINGVWVQLLRVPYGLLYPMILTFFSSV